MYDKYDSPHDGEEPQDFGPSAQDQIGGQAGPVIDALRGNWKLIVGAIALLLVAYFAYDFFVGSYREVSVRPMEGSVGYLAIFAPPAVRPRPADIKPCRLPPT